MGMGMIKGITVTLHERTQTGTDDFGAPIYAEIAVQVDNVLVSPTTAQDITDSLQLYGKYAAYELSLPKYDTHTWDDCRVDFFGRSWRVFGPAKEWIADMIPGEWNKKVMVERYG